MDPDLAQQITVDHNTEKHPDVAPWVELLTGEGSMVTTNGPFWKKWRTIMNPGFAASHLITLVPAILDECRVFCETLSGHAKKKEVFRMETTATHLTIDIIGRVTM